MGGRRAYYWRYRNKRRYGVKSRYRLTRRKGLYRRGYPKRRPSLRARALYHQRPRIWAGPRALSGCVVRKFHVFAQNAIGSYSSFDNVLDYKNIVSHDDDQYDAWPGSQRKFMFSSNMLNDISQHVRNWQEYRVTWVQVVITAGERIGPGHSTHSPSNFPLVGAGYMSKSQAMSKVWYALKRQQDENENFAQDKWSAGDIPGYKFKTLTTGGEVSFGFAPSELLPGAAAADYMEKPVFSQWHRCTNTTDSYLDPTHTDERPQYSGYHLLFTRPKQSMGAISISMRATVMFRGYRAQPVIVPGE